jgi:Domain of unknown function (DUF4386)
LTGTEAVLLLSSLKITKGSTVMVSMAVQNAPTTGAKVEGSSKNVTGWLLIGQLLVFLTAPIGLGVAIGWPASLDEPASVVLPLIRDNRTVVNIGYFGYFISALMLIPIALLLRGLLQTSAKNDRLLLVATGIGVLAGAFKMIGILRWFTVMPFLADSYVSSGTTSGTREALTVAYDTFNKYGGGIGETLGVTLFGGLWTVLVAAVILGDSRLPTWLGIFGLIAGVGLLVGLVEIFGLALPGIFLTLNGVVWQLWMVTLGIVLLTSRIVGNKV